jgi:hypothetical protein
MAHHLKPLDCSLACVQAGIVPSDAMAQFDTKVMVFSAPTSDAMLMHHMRLSMSFLKAAWASMKMPIMNAMEDTTYDLTIYDSGYDRS